MRRRCCRSVFILCALASLLSCKTVERHAPSTMLAAIDPVAPVGFELIDFIESRRDAEWGVFSSLSSVAVAMKGDVFFADPGRGEIHRLDPEGAYLGGVDSAGERLSTKDLATRGRRLFVLDADRGLVLRYSAEGAYRDIYLDLQKLSRVDRVDAAALAVDRDGRLAVADLAQHQVLLTGPFLELDTAVGEWGPFEGQLDEPSGVAFGLEGILYTADLGNRRVQAFDRTGFLLAASKSVNDIDPPLIAPRGMDCDIYGNVYVCDEAAGEIVVFSPQLDEIARLGGDDAGDARLRRPTDCAVGPGDLLYVTDPGRGALMVYRILYP